MAGRIGTGKIDALIEGLEAIRDDMVFTIGEVVNRQEGALIEGIIDNLYKGVDGHKKRISPPYTAFTKKEKKKKGAPYDRVTLMDTGAFYDSLTLMNTGDGVLFKSRNTEYWHESLPEKYGYSILRPDDNSIKENIIVPLRDEILKQLKEIEL